MNWARRAALCAVVWACAAPSLLAQADTMPAAPTPKVSEESAQSRLASLRRVSDADDDLDRIIRRFEAFIDFNAGTQAASDARADLDRFRELKSKNAVKVGDRWLDEAEQRELFFQNLDAIERLRELIDTSQIPAARQMIEPLLQAQPRNVSFIYLDGVIRLREGQLGMAKRRFSEVLEQVPEHAPSLNNMAATVVAQNRVDLAPPYLERAMRIAPDRPVLIDNAAELLRIIQISRESRRMSHDRLARAFADQDERLQRQRAAEGLYRWGSGWVTKEKLDQIEAERRTFEQKRDEILKSMADKERERLELQRRIDSDYELLRWIENNSIFVDANGRIIRRSYPSSYWDAQRSIRENESRRDSLRDEIRLDEAELRRLEEAQPNPPFIGRLQTIGSEGVPVIVPPGIEWPPMRPPKEPDESIESTATESQSPDEESVDPASIPVQPAEDSASPR